MTFGRPAIVSKQLADNRPYPAMIDDEYLSDDPNVSAIQPDGQPSTMAFYVKTLELYDIVSKTLSILYIENDAWIRKGHSAHVHQPQNLDMANILQLDRDLLSWAQSLPSYLRLSSQDSLINNAILRQAVICRIRCVK